MTAAPLDLAGGARRGGPVLGRALRGLVGPAMRAVAAVLVRLALALALLVGASVLAPMFAGEQPRAMFTSLETPPTKAEVAEALAAGIRIFELDLDADGAPEAVAAIKAGGGRITAYHVGGGGGRAWGSVKAGEFVRYYNEPKAFLALTADVRRLVALGADAIHFDNTHRMSGRRLESIADAIVAGGAGFVAKNNPDKWRLVMERRKDRVPAYAVVEDAMFDADDTQAAYDLHDKGVAVFVVGFRKPIELDAAPVTDDYAAAYKMANPWATVLLMDDEARYDSRTGRFF